jgi:hypothetical protein
MRQVVSTALRSRQFPENRFERNRRLMVRLIFVIYWLLIFEGVLRKWLIPQSSSVLFFIRDPFVAWIYWLALSRGMRPQRSTFLIFGLAFSVIAFPLIIVQFASSPYVHSLMLSGYGWRNYFYYLPLTFFIAKYFRPRDFERLMRWTMICAIPVAILVFFQFRAPAGAPINRGLAPTSEEVGTGTGAEGAVRPEGTFTSNPGQGAFVGSVVAMLLAAWLRPKSKRPVRGVLLLAATAGAMTCLALSGSRGALVEAGIIFVGGIGAALLSSGRSLALQKLLIPIAGLAVGVLLAPLVFPQAVRALTVRWENAGYAESHRYGGGGIFGRALNDFSAFRFLLTTTPPQGYQMGLGGNAAGAISRTNTGGKNGSLYDPRLILFGPQELAGVESDWGRQIIELGPVLGILFILFRVAFVFWLGKEALIATIRSGDPLPMLFFTFVAVYLFNGQITGHGSLNGYGWMFAGFCMSINNQAALQGMVRQKRPSRQPQRTARIVGFGSEPQIARS